MKILQTIYRTILIACFATWFGGFGFYVSIVVPIGTDLLGSSRHQGVITEQVTPWLNLFGVIAVCAMLLESFFSWNYREGTSKWWMLGSATIVGVCLAGLIGLHPVLDSMFDASEMEISDEEKFYQIHRIYLWLSTVQWIAGWIWLSVFCFRWPKDGRGR